MTPPSRAEDDVAFRARVFDINEFQNEILEVSLQQSPKNQRRKRNANVVNSLEPNATYRTAQLNTDVHGVGYRAILPFTSCLKPVFH
jgi:hypothetical protein